MFFKELGADGARRVHYYRSGSAASRMSAVDAGRALAARPRLAVVSGLTAALGPGPRSAVQHLALGADVVALDPNLRPHLPPVDDLLLTLLPQVTYLLLGLDEAGPLFGTTEPAQVFRRARSAGVREVALKAGADGCYHADDGPAGFAHLPSAATTVADPVGAGDAFAGGYLAARLVGAGPRGAAWLGSRLAAAVVATPGDTEGLPSAAEAAALLAAALSR
ncbi:hypothetical protein GCM10018962_69100 [Dactylosporangium matsuzakiense]|uniref:PfkB family carbohydrate kinase n=1 Tax=Dactylosporangium matsuzakiense TaxID=53360 RepID=UPI0031F087A1